MDTNIDKVVNPVQKKTYVGRVYNVFCRIEFRDGALSIIGVEGPLSNGGCLGSVGQIYDELVTGIHRYVAPWDAEKVLWFVKVWKRWHLNDLRSDCEHQREHWNPDKMLTINTHYLKDEVSAYRDRLKADALAALARGETVSLDGEDKVIIGLAEWVDVPDSEPPSTLYYDAAKKSEKLRACWVKPSKHPDGILCKPCEVCGYRYGTKYFHEVIPNDVIYFLETLPVTVAQPAWI